MKSKWRLKLLSLMLVLLVAMTAAPIRVEARGVHLNKTKITITEGDSVASFEIASYNEDMVIPFTVSTKSGSAGELSDEDIERIGQKQLKMTMAGCRLCLLKKTGYKLNEIGFTNY